MKWTSGDRSNIEDRRGSRAAVGAGGLGIGGLLLLFALSWATGIDFTSLAGGGGAVQPDPGGQSAPITASPQEEARVDMVDAVLAESEATWGKLLGGRYQETVAVVFRDATNSACGFAQSATGPFYCPADRKVYLDLGFFDELASKLGAPGDFAQAYVIAHEIGHHVQTLIGTETQVRRRQAASPGDRNELSVRMELQADCYAGIWGHYARNSQTGRVTIETGDIEAGLNAAGAIGDDRLQRMQGGRVAPDRFTHGSSQQRIEWFKRGLESGDPNVCNTFQAGT
jgi:predicted metalloprotease